MVRQNYLGVTDPVTTFEELKPFVNQLINIRSRCKPFGRDYHAVCIALEAIDTMAYHFTRRPHFYGLSGRHQ
jgi:hypothetical protein